MYAVIHFTITITKGRVEDKAVPVTLTALPCPDIEALRQKWRMSAAQQSSWPFVVSFPGKSPALIRRQLQETEIVKWRQAVVFGVFPALSSSSEATVPGQQTTVLLRCLAANVSGQVG